MRFYINVVKVKFEINFLVILLFLFCVLRVFEVGFLVLVILVICFLGNVLFVLVFLWVFMSICCVSNFILVWLGLLLLDIFGDWWVLVFGVGEEVFWDLLIFFDEFVLFDKFFVFWFVVGFLLLLVIFLLFFYLLKLGIRGGCFGGVGMDFLGLFFVGDVWGDGCLVVLGVFGFADRKSVV